MTDPDVVLDDSVTVSEEVEDRRDRRWRVMLAVILLLVLLLCCAVNQAQVWTTGGSQRARFIARNIACLQCHTELITDFTRATVHNPFATKDCGACHTPHGKKVSVSVWRDPVMVWRRYRAMIEWLPYRLWLSIREGRAGRIRISAGEVEGSQTRSVEVKGRDSELILPENELCWLCHGNLGPKLADPFRHQPFAAGRCTNCHDPHASDHRGLLAQSSDTICLTCHPIGREINRDQAHSPVARGLCLECHDPHASQFRGMIVTNQRALCFRCHVSVAMLDGMPVQHAPLMNDDCTACHEPHGSEHRPLLRMVQPNLCYGCHPGTQDQFAAVSHHPVGVTLTCSSCHDPHAAQFEGLITARDNDFCYGCHNQIKPAFQRSGHDIVLCIRCHTPHGSDHAPMLRNRNPELCFECHARSHFDESAPGIRRNNHPVRPVHYDVNSRTRLTCTSSCHNPHGTENKPMLRYFAYPEDGGCLMCHATPAGRIVGIDF